MNPFPSTVRPALTAAIYLLISAAATLPTTAAPAPDESKASQFRELMKSTASATPGMTVQGKAGWLFLKNEFRHIGAGKFWGEEAVAVSQAQKKEHADPLPAITDFRRQLGELGIELIMIPVPPKAFAYPELTVEAAAVYAGGERLDAVHRQFYAVLTAKGITVLDILPDLQALRKAGTPAWCQTDTHWSVDSSILVARKIAALMKEKPWYAAAAGRRFVTEQKTIEFKGDLATGVPGGDVQENLTIRVVKNVDGSALEPDRRSPVLLLADSHGLVFSTGGDMLASGAGFFEQLACESGLVPARIAVRGSGATPARVTLYRTAMSDPEFLPGKKLVIWLFTAREFTEASGWQLVPVKPK